MSYTLTNLDDGQIIVLTQQADYDPQNDRSAPEILALLESGPDAVVLIYDSRQFTMTNMNQVLAVGASARSDEGKAITKHPRVKAVLVVTSSKLAQLTVKGINSATFGFVNLPVFDSLEDALNHARTLLYGQSKAN